MDNDPEKRGPSLNGIPILGCFEQLEELIEKRGARGMVVTSPKMPPAISEEIEEVRLRRGIAYLQFHIPFGGTLIVSRDRAKEGAVAVGKSPLVDRSVSKVEPCR